MQKMMDALVKPERAKGLILTQVPVPEPGIGEVLIKIHKTAICGTDVHIYNWDPWSQQHINPPMVIGHEYVGEIAALGPGVTEYKVGQIVSGEGHIVCGHCRNCRAGNGQWCKETKGVGVDRQGAFAEYVCIPKTNVILMPDDIPEDIISFFDAYGNATHTATMFDVVGEDVLITGAGPIGMMAVGICRQNGARNIIVTDVNDYRLNIAKQMGATATVNLTHEKLEDAMADLDVLYMTRVQRERFFNEEDYVRLKDFYVLTKEKMELAKDDMLVLHPLPRVNEISVEVDDDPRACYFKQAQYGVYVRMALILTLLGLA